MRTGRPITLPGFWGPLAAQEGGVQVLAEKLGVKDVRTLRRWACNERGIDAIVAAKIEDLEPPEGAFKVYLDPITADLVASAPEGWVRFDAVRNGWARRSAWIGNPYDLLPGDPDKARAAGWPWWVPAKTQVQNLEPSGHATFVHPRKEETRHVAMRKMQNHR